MHQKRSPNRWHLALARLQLTLGLRGGTASNETVRGATCLAVEVQVDRLPTDSLREPVALLEGLNTVGRHTASRAGACT